MFLFLEFTMIYYKQEQERSCWAACVKMILGKLGQNVSEDFLIKKLKTNHKLGTSTKNIIKFLEKEWINFTYCVNWNIQQMNNYLKTHILLIRYHLPKEKTDHYALYVWMKEKRIHLWDPWYGKNHTYSFDYFNKHRKSTREDYEKWFIAVKK